AITSMIFLPANMIVPEDAATTTNNIASSEGAFRISITGDAIIFLIELMLVVMLYNLLKPVNQTLALIATFARLAMIIIQAINIINHFAVLTLVSDSNFLNAFQPGQIQALVMLLLDIHSKMVYIWGVAFFLHLPLLGYLVIKSGYIPKLLGIALIVAGLCYFIQSFGNILLPQFESIFTTIGFLSIIELAFPLWLVIKGAKDQA
ncbi:MAG: DUF4386 domain-containing protein, partial [Anaerolineales bacterium]